METKKVEKRKPETGKSPRLNDERVSVAKNDPQSEEVDDLGFDPRDFGLSDQQALFVFWYVRTKNRVEAYKKAGYKCEGKNLHFGAAQIYRNIKVSRAIKALAKRVRQRYTADLDEIVDQLVAITRADPNLVSQHRRVNCRFCWGEENKYQWRDESEYEVAAIKASENGKPPPEDGGTGFIDNADPNPDCPRCQGEGKGQMIINDTRDLEGDELMYYLGVKQTKNGLEVLTESKQAARAALIRILEIKEANKPAVPVVPEEDYQLQPLNTDEPTPDNPIL
ncbi:terminase small subunit [Enterobacter chengduensis]|nr:terminase small subunit [Enterobacter chengduensis]HDS5491274.1 terminase small subunit [Enterobacter chengduensis]HDT2588490.1 terminase small subunit [Enterobacter chengduensis]